MEGIEVKKAKDVLKKLDEARAGNRDAQKEIFRDSAVYSKMYIAMQAKNGDPMALDFLYKRGLTDVDFNDPLCLTIIRKALMKDAGQKDANKRKNYLNSVTKAAIKTGCGQLVGSAVIKGGKELSKLPNKTMKKVKKDTKQSRKNANASMKKHALEENKVDLEDNFD